MSSVHCYVAIREWGNKSWLVVTCTLPALLGIIMRVKDNTNYKASTWSLYNKNKTKNKLGEVTVAQAGYFSWGERESHGALGTASALPY